jgi:uncharacterized membrane protein YfcA
MDGEKPMSSIRPPAIEAEELTREDQALIREGAAPSIPTGLRVLRPIAQALGLGGVALLVGAIVALVVLVGATVGTSPLTDVMTLTVYLPVADNSMPVVMVVGVGFAVGILSGMTGVGGGFLMTPLLITIGVPSAVAVGTDSAQIAGTGSSGAVAHSRLGNVDVKLGVTILVGSLVGGTVGVQVVRILQEMGSFDFWVRVVYILMLSSVGGLMLRESLRTWIRSSRIRTIQALVDEGFKDLRVKLVEDEKPREEHGYRRFVARLPLQTEYKRAGIRVSALIPCGMGLGIGFLTAIMGVGGGFIMVPAMIYVLGMPTHVAVGTSLFQMVCTSTNVAFQQAIVNHSVDIMLAVMLMVGAAIGAQIGARVSGRLEGHQLRTILGVIVVLVVVKLLFDLMLEPSSLFGVTPLTGGGH